MAADSPDPAQANLPEPGQRSAAAAPLPGANAGWAGYAVRAWLAATVPPLLWFLARIAAGTASLHPPAKALEPAFAAYSLLAAPLLETALMLPVASLLALVAPRRARVRIVLLATLGALAHYFGGGWRQVFATFWPFLVYAATLVTWMPRSGRDAFLLTSFVHALYNATFFGVGAIGALLADQRG
jgi:hypothetical protein